MFPGVHPDKMLTAIEFSIDLGVPAAATDAAAAVLVYDHLGGKIARIIGGPRGPYSGFQHFYVVDTVVGMADFLGDRFRDFNVVEAAQWVERDVPMAVPGATEAYDAILDRITQRLA